MRVGILIALVVSHAFGLTATAVEPIEIASRRELFVDRHLVAELKGGAELYLHKPQLREVALVTDMPWEGNTCAYYTVFQDDDRFRMYYRGSHYDENSRQPAHREVTCYAESKNGIDWTKPQLGLFEFAGTTKNNIVWDGIGTHCFAVFKDDNPNCKSESRYKAIARGRPRGEVGLYIFQSVDGTDWLPISDDPVITQGAFDSQNLAFWDPHAKRQSTPPKPYYTGPESRIRRFTYRVDGFVSLCGASAGGELVTKPLTFQGDHLSVNYATARGGSVRVELQDARGNPLRSFQLADGDALDSGDIDQTVTWHGRSDVGTLAGQPIQIGFSVKDGDLYSFRFGS